MNSPWDKSEQDWNDTQAFQGNPYRGRHPYPEEPDSHQEGEEQAVDNSPPPNTFSGILIHGFCTVMIVLVVLFIFRSRERPEIESGKTSPRGDLVELTIQSKIVLGAKAFAKSTPELKQEVQKVYLSVRFGYFGSVRMRQAGAVIVAEMESRDDAMLVLQSLQQDAEKYKYQFTDSEQETTRILQKLFQGSANDLLPGEIEHLQNELPWFSRLALNAEPDPLPEKVDRQRETLLLEAATTLVAMLGFIVVGLFGLLVGLVGAGIMFLMYGANRLKLRTKLVSGEPTIYLESFTVWLLSFILFSLIIGLNAPTVNPLVANAVVFASSFAAALFWSALRGSRRGSFREDVGFVGNPLAEIPAAIWCYLCTLPLVLVGMIGSSVLMSRFATDAPGGFSSSGPSHPILEWVMDKDPTTITLIFFVACVCAPIVEETMFRGLLYRSLKDNSFRFGHQISTLFAAVVNGLLFAAIHPQGIFFIPPLCALGIGFSLAREWRGTLWTPVLMHALHNGILTCLLVFVVGG